MSGASARAAIVSGPTNGACDGFNVMFPFVPEGLDDVVDRLVPEL